MRWHLVVRHEGDDIRDIVSDIYHIFRPKWGHSDEEFLDDTLYFALSHYLQFFIEDELVPLFFERLEFINNKKKLCHSLNFERLYSRSFELLRFVQRDEKKPHFKWRSVKQFYIDSELRIDVPFFITDDEE